MTTFGITSVVSRVSLPNRSSFNRENQAEDKVIWLRFSVLLVLLIAPAYAGKDYTKKNPKRCRQLVGEASFRHEKGKHGKRKYICSQCKTEFSHLKQIRDHLGFSFFNYKKIEGDLFKIVIPEIDEQESNPNAEKLENNEEAGSQDQLESENF